MVTAVDAAIGQVLAALEQRGMLDGHARGVPRQHRRCGQRKYPIGDGDTSRQRRQQRPLPRRPRRPVRRRPAGGRARRLAPDQDPAGRRHRADPRGRPLPDAARPGRGADRADQAARRPGHVAHHQRRASLQPRKEVLLNVEEFRGAHPDGRLEADPHRHPARRTELYNLRADPSEEDNQAEREPERVQTMLHRLAEYAWEMAPAAYLEALAKPLKVEVPIYWGDNPARSLETRQLSDGSQRGRLEISLESRHTAARGYRRRWPETCCNPTGRP